MTDLVDRLPTHDRRLVHDLAADAGVPPATMLVEICRAYLSLVRAVPEALPNDPLRRGVQAEISRGMRS